MGSRWDEGEGKELAAVPGTFLVLFLICMSVGAIAHSPILLGAAALLFVGFLATGAKRPPA